MEAPRCRDCGVREWRHVCAGVVRAKLVVDKPAVVTRNRSAPPVVTRNQCHGCAEKDKLISDLRRQLATQKPRGAPKRDRAEYMRARRAESRAK